ncbi:Gfo/Idh/MocA family oxidoreductase [Nitrosomonas europaea]|uniref:Gfo/Idh/MocA family protein n=1 Tax=Nitrosomonas europaea TaxID=915 RepID=UPI0032654E97
MTTKQRNTVTGTARKLRAAFLGGAYSSAAGRLHRAAVEMDQRYELVAGCFSRNSATNRDSALQYGIASERTYGSLDALLAAEMGNIDTIIILTPTGQHKSQVLRCLNAGIPVICEKALATSTDEASEIEEQLRQGGFLAVTYNYTGYPMVRELKRMLEQGRLGKIQQIHVEMPQEGFVRVNREGAPIVPQEWRLHDGKIPTISLDLGVHLHMLVRFLCGEKPISVVATSDSFGNFAQIIDNVSCLARYTNNINCNIWFSKTALGQRNGMKVRVYGRTGSAEWLQEAPEYLHLADNQGRRFVVDRASGEVEVCNQIRYTRFKAGHPTGFIEAFANYYYDIADVLHLYLETRSSPTNSYVFGIEETLEGFRLFDAIAESSVSQRWIDVQ